MKTYISSVAGAVALAVCFVASAQTFKTDEQIEAMGYSHIYSLSIPDYTNFKVNGVPYSVNNSNLNLGPIESVAYRLNLGEDNFCYTSFGAYTSDLTRIGVPVYANQNIQQRYVHNLYYEAKSPLLNTAGTSVSQGNIEFWYLNYEQNNAAGIPNASGATDRSGYDFGDKATNGFHGSMQVHDYQNRTTIFAFNNWNNAGEDAALGVGNSNIGNTGPDWTFAVNSQSYNVKQLDIFAKPVFSQMSESDYSAISGEVSGMKLLYKLDCPLQGQYSANNYTINNSVNSDLSGMPLKRVGYYMTLEKADGSVDYAYAGYDATTNDLNQLGLPFDGSVRQQTVNNMTVRSNVPGVVNGSGIATGNIEMWNTDYNQNNSANIPNASGSEFDFGDNPTGNGTYGSFQIHNYGAGQTVMALNKWNGQASGNKSIDIGIGNNTGAGSSDYTFNGDNINTSNASQYQTRSLYVLAQPAIAPGMENVADASKYVLVQGAKLTTQMGAEWRADYQGVDYNIANNVAQLQKTLGPFDRVGYYMEYAQTANSDLNYVFVSFDTMTADISKIGVPVYGTGESYQQTVKNMQVTTNVPATEGLISAPGTNTQATPNTTYAHNTGYLEFWPSNYGKEKANIITQGDGNTLDINDSGNNMTLGHGSMQIHSVDTEQTIFALNNFRAAKAYGIGTNPNASTNSSGSQRDWTFDSGKTGYAIANIYTFAKPVLSDMDAEHFQPIQSEAANMHLVYKLDCPLNGTYSADNYTVNNLNNLGDLAGMPLKRVAYYMTLEKADGTGTDYAYASYDATTNNPANIGMPFDGSIRQGLINNLTVSSNVPGVINGTGLSGNIEMWKNTYERTNSANIPGASDSAYDTGDKPTNGSYGSFQIHNYGNNQTVMALNAWNGVATSASRTIDIGIGNNNTGAGDPDYTFNGDQGANSNASQYSNRTLYVMAEAALAPGMANVTNGSEYTMVQGVRLTTQMGTNWHDNGVNYDIVNNLATLQGQGILFDRVGYYMEYAATANDPLTYVFASFDAMTNDIGRIGIPTSKSGEFYQQVVSNLEVTTNATTSQGLINDPTTGQQAAPNITISHNQGYIEFWASNYGQAKSGIISQGDDNTFDINDSGGSTGAGHGSMQVHSLATEQTIFALNHLNGAKQYGIGTNPNASTTSSGGQRDWTHDESKTGYAIANVYTFVHPVDALLTTNAMSMYQRDLANTADVKLAGTWAVSNGITIDALQASVDGGDWINLTMNSDGTFTGTTSLIGGMHDVQYQALDSNGNVIATKSGQIGVGEIFITAGQSNSTNYGDAAQSSTSPLAYAYNPKTGQWQHNADPQQGPLDNSTRGSTWPAFADKMAELEGVPIATYSVGYGGTSQDQWATDWNGIYTNFENAMDFLNENANGFAGVLWHQGESDRGTAENVYYDKLNALIERSREDSGNEDLPWGVAIASADGNGTTYANVTNAQYRVIADDPLVFEGVNTDEYPRELRGEGGNSIHLSVAGLQRAGEDWALTAGEDIVGLRKYWLANSDEATAIPNWEVNGGYKLGIKLVDGDAQSVETDNAVQMANDGTIEVGEGYDLTLTGNVSGNGAMLKIGDGALTFSGDRSEYTGKTAVSNGTLTLSGAAIPSNGSVEAANDTTLVYNVDAGDSQQLTLSNDVTLTADIVRKTGEGQLKIKADGTQFTANDFAVEAGELDFKGDYNGNLEIKSGATLSPGNSVGDLTVIGNVVIDAGATGLFEFSAYNPDPDSQEFDTLTVADDGSLTLDADSIIQLYFENGDAALWAEEGAEYQLVADNGFAADTTDLSGLLANYQTMFALQGRTDGLYLIGLGAPEPGSGVPEPSTWALLILGTVGLFWLRRKNSSKNAA
ncbi:MAG: PEP-CTERM sorting domain-containing protein [Thermoguttaceae bacterium]|nr:PEP-CTERM sorting domain-containing protein [Thermoguttaceae bacterium]